MSAIELKETFSKLDRAGLLKWFTAVEVAWNEILPVSTRYYDLLQEQENCKKGAKPDPNAGKIAKIIAIPLAVIGLLMIISSGRTDWFSGFFRKVFGFAGLIAAVICFATGLFLKKDDVANTKKCAARLQELETLVPEAERKAQEVVNKHPGMVQVLQVICPKECANPAYLRVFVSYFEDGRADNLKEAYALFEEKLHRDKMEGHAQTQTQAALATEAAARAAASAAASAATSAAQTAVWTRYKD